MQFRDLSEETVCFYLHSLNYAVAQDDDSGGLAPKRRYRARELWTSRERVVRGFLSARVPAHGVALFRVTP